MTHTGEKERERDFVNLCGPDTGLFRLTYGELWKSIRGTLDCTYVCVCERERDKHYLSNRHQTLFPYADCRVGKRHCF